jgi:probable rRNA maturation factor
MNALIKKTTTNSMKALVDVQWAVEGEGLPSEQEIKTWVEAVLMQEQNDIVAEVELTVRIASEEEVAELNQQYRQKQGSTNVLSFPVDEGLPLDVPLLGDLVICAPVVEKEAKQQNKTLLSHWAHMVVHGTLHLLGYDHIEADQAEAMEQKEIAVLQGLGFSNPYEVATGS